MVRDVFPEKDGWKEIGTSDELWKPEAMGDHVTGKYIQKDEDVGVHHNNMYILHEENEEDLETPIVHKIIGTTDLDKKFQDVKIGTEIGIIYKGEKPSKPPHKPFKMFIVKKRTFENEDDEVENSLGDPVALKCINEITDDLITEDENVNEESILKRAKEYHINKESGYQDPKILGRIEKQLQHKG